MLIEVAFETAQWSVTLEPLVIEALVALPEPTVKLEIVGAEAELDDEPDPEFVPLPQPESTDSNTAKQARSAR